MNESPTTIIIGAGLSGLQTALLLAQQGLKVTVVEQGQQLGGCLQQYKRKKNHYDTGFHYVGSLNSGEMLHRLFDRYNLLNLPWQKLDEDCFDEVIMNNTVYHFPMGIDRFFDYFIQLFPKEKSALCDFKQILIQIGESIEKSIDTTHSRQPQDNPYYEISAYQFIEDSFKDTLLKKLLVANAFKMDLDPNTLPLYIYAQISYSYIQSSWRLYGGGQTLIDQLEKQLIHLGVNIIRKSKVTQLFVENKIVTQVEINNKQILTADWIISSAHPQTTLSWIKQENVIRKSYVKRINQLENSMGLFTASITLKPKMIEYVNHNIFINKDSVDFWHKENNHCGEALFISMNALNPEQQKSLDKGEIQYAETLDILTYMPWDELKTFEDSTTHHRQQQYTALKEKYLQTCIQQALKRFPNLKEAIQDVYTSTPLTYAHYVSVPQGGAYGLKKDYKNPLTSFLVPQTPITNLLLTGQNISIHGILGVSITSLLTSNYLLHKIQYPSIEL